MKRLNKNMHGDDPAFYRLPEDHELAAQYLLLYELSVPFGMDLNNRIDIGKSATRMTVTLHRLKSEEMRKLEVRGAGLAPRQRARPRDRGGIGGTASSSPIWPYGTPRACCGARSRE